MVLHLSCCCHFIVIVSTAELQQSCSLHCVIILMDIFAGKLTVLEKKRARMAAAAGSDDSALGSDAVEPRCNCAVKLTSLEGRVSQLKKQKADLELGLAKSRDCLDASKMVKRLKHMLEKASVTESVSVSSRKVDIGDGVLVEEGTLARLKKDSSNSACRFAMGLLRAVFTPEELINKSLFGKKSNAHKENVVKEALDPRRVNAVLGFTLQNYKETSALNVKNTPSSMLARDYAPDAVQQPN
ncbi:uncharacterized protein LOC125939828 [Dermacentor silvarum]|uniref:uncharacterized protein LOC125939828 n=1 Tax=Dermacentor silvarum TaxID=543639 RepID=UPI002100B58F|nr:uncharacterized protein LOC125939828 [Dermacentor silvarum]